MMRKIVSTAGYSYLWFLLAWLPQSLSAAETSFSVGAEYSSGDYGTGIETTGWKLPFAIEHRGDETLFSLTVPYLVVEGSSEVSGVRGTGVNSPHKGSSGGGTIERTGSGIGDVLFRASYQFQRETPTRPWLGVTAKVKFGTADEKKNFGTGENDYGFQLDAAKGAFDGVLGYRLIGDTGTVDFNDIVYGSVGYRRPLPEQWGMRVEFYAEEPVLDGVDPVRELALGLSKALSPVRGMRFTLFKGLTDSSPDWGVGVVVVTLL